MAKLKKRPFGVRKIMGAEYYPAARDQIKIRQLLTLPSHAPWPRCRHQDKRKIEALCASGDMSHIEKGHLCEKCRCDNIAGIGSYDDLYGIPGAGHFGAGWCGYHEIHERQCGKLTKGNVLQMAKNHITALMTMGDSTSDENAYIERLNEDAGIAVDYQETRRSIKMMHDYIEEFFNRFKPEQQVKSVFEKRLEELKDSLKGVQFVDPEQATRIQDCLDECLLWEGTLTESSKSGPVRMSDETKAVTLSTLARTMGLLEKNQFTMSEKDYIAYDEVLIRLNRMYDLVKRMLQKLHEGVIRGEEHILGDVNRDFLLEFKAIWDKPRRGRK